MTENRLNHKLDTSKIKTLKDVRNLFEILNMSVSLPEDNELYELAKEYFTIPNTPQEFKFEYPRKSLEEIQEEFDKKIDKHIEDVEYKFAQLKYYQEYQFSKVSHNTIWFLIQIYSDVWLNIPITYLSFTRNSKLCVQR